MRGLCHGSHAQLQPHHRNPAQASGQELPALYWRYARWWEGLGYPAFVAMLAIFYLMVAKPDL